MHVKVWWRLVKIVIPLTKRAKQCYVPKMISFICEVLFCRDDNRHGQYYLGLAAPGWIYRTGLGQETIEVNYSYNMLKR